MPPPYTGGCQCGRIRYEIRADPLTLYCCHCTECQRQSSSAFGMSMPVLTEAVVVTQGEPKEWRRKADGGREVICRFCPDCGTRLFHNPTRNLKVTNVKPGTLDDTKWLRPIGHLWTRSAQPWVTMEEGTLRYESQPQDFTPLFERWVRSADVQPE